jgi:hypothetical protein
MTDKERIDSLERKVQTLQETNYIRFVLLSLTFLGVTGYFLKQISKKK